MVDWAFEIPYVSGGRTESGADCWGLVVLFYNKHMNIDLPLYEWVAPDKSTMHKTTCEQAKQMALDIGLFEEVDSPEYGDLVLLNIMGMPIHIGVVIDKNLMLHTGSSHGVVVEDFTEMKWKRRIKSFHRYKK